MKAIDKLIKWLESKTFRVDVSDVLAKARELRDAEQKEPPYDREAFRRELIVEAFKKMKYELYTYDFIAERITQQADAIIAEYERRQGNG